MIKVRLIIIIALTSLFGCQESKDKESNSNQLDKQKTFLAYTLTKEQLSLIEDPDFTESLSDFNYYVSEISTLIENSDVNFKGIAIEEFTICDTTIVTGIDNPFGVILINEDCSYMLLTGVYSTVDYKNSIKKFMGDIEFQE